MNIMQFIESPLFLNDQSLSVAQKMSLKSFYGLNLDQTELEIFKQTTGLFEYAPGKEWSEGAFIIGRRGGKSDKIASNIALFEATAREHELSVGQVGVVMVVASEKKRQAKIVYDYILAKLERSRILSKLIQNITSECITLTNGVEIQVFPCDPGKVRGFSLVCFIGDEVAAWMHEGKRVDVDILDSVRPGLDFDYSKMVKISTPSGMVGEIYQDFKRYHGKSNDDVIVFQGSTELYNPLYTERRNLVRKLERLKKRKPSTYAVEYMAQFRKDEAAMYDPQMIDKAVNKSRPLELSPQKEIVYFAFVDVAGGGGKDSYALAIGHRLGDWIIIDVVRSHAPPFNPDAVSLEYAKLCAQYRIRQIFGDKFSGDWPLNSWAKHSRGTIEYLKSEMTKSELYLEIEGLINTEMIEIPNKELSIEQLKDLRRRSRRGGRDSVDSSSGAPEDEANVIAGCAAHLITGEDEKPISLGIYQAAAGSKGSKFDELSSEDQEAVEVMRKNAWLLDDVKKDKEEPFERTVIEGENGEEIELADYLKRRKLR